MTAGRRLWCALDRAALAYRRVSRSLHKCRPSAAKLEKVQRNSRTYTAPCRVSLPVTSRACADLRTPWLSHRDSGPVRLTECFIS